MNALQPELSVIIPTLNEEIAIADLFASLATQTGISLEVVISDGGSTDDTCRRAESLAARCGIRMQLVTGASGRGAQMNAAVAASRGKHLLFLHADSRFAESSALRKGADILAEYGDTTVAAKFALRFGDIAAPQSLGYYFYESKARLLRPECSHGDQGLLITRSSFDHLGPFDTFPPMLAETRLADKVRAQGRLLLIPAELLTSARRFEAEGLQRRQTINAILMNCAGQKWDEPFRAIADLYRDQSATGELQLFPILDRVKRLIVALPRKERRSFWERTGSYVRGNAWQLAFFLDVRRNFKKGIAPGNGPTPVLDGFDRHIAPLLDNKGFNLLATVLTWAWFNYIRRRSRVHS
ncbi:PGL/p-HBAD biosynthesis glycosyltransferase [Geobacter sp. OR-1]|uniref:glycosyltransferase n=1 Tax=Geobacter sp. OR-1 TaxID=1266765 RepID=UPI0005432C0E|nr:glycosyltransferase [Geobacter sp. OR-1]GAM09011.1 PGL/p-HBAD biosynthesis glycosyltransferase [Geobacter sp. OR-1]